MKQGSLVVSNKLKPPHLRMELRRSRLISLGYGGNDKKVMTIIAGPGYGKTTLMAQIAKSRLGETMWYQIDSMDSDPMVFLRHMVYGLSGASGTETKRSKERLEYIEDIDSEGEQIAELLCRELASTQADPITLCIDDCHLLRDYNTRHILKTILDNLPQDMFVILSSRNNLKLSLGKLRTSGELQELRRQDLLFSREEIRLLLEDIWELQPSEEIIEQLHSRMGGWPAGLVLMESHIRSNNSIPKLFTNHRIRRNIYGYLAEETLNGLTEELSGALILCAPLDPIDPEVAAEVTGNADVVSLLDKAESLNLFISSVDGTNQYRYHPMFRTFLMDMLEERKGSAYVTDLRERYGAELKKRGNLAGAIEQFIDAGITERAVPLLEEHGSEMFRDGEYVTLNRWLESIDPDKFTPPLLLSLGRIKMISGQIEDALEILRVAEPKINDPIINCECAITIAECLGDIGKWEQGLEVLNRICVTNLPTDSLFDITFQRCRLHFIGADFEDAQRLGVEAQLLIDDLFDKRKRNHVHYLLGMQNLMYGNFAKAYESLSVYDDISEIHGNQRSPHINALAYCLLLKADYAHAKSIITDCMQMVKKMNQKMWIAPLHDTLGCIEYGIGNREKAVDLIEEALRSTIGKSCNAEAIAYCHKGTIFRWSGYFDDALDFHKTASIVAQEKGEIYDQVMSDVNIAADLVFLEEYDKADEMLSRVKFEAEKFNLGYALTKIHYHYAWLAFKQQNQDESMVHLSIALRNANIHCQNHFIVHEGRQTLEMLSKALINGVETKYTSWILKRIGVPSLAVAKPLLSSHDHRVRLMAVRIIHMIGDAKGLTMLRQVARDNDKHVQEAAKRAQEELRDNIASPRDLITNREMQIIELLNTGATNAGIARDLFISEQTVKTHITNIMRKMGLNSRLEIALYYQSKLQR